MRGGESRPWLSPSTVAAGAGPPAACKARSRLGCARWILASEPETKGVGRGSSLMAAESREPKLGMPLSHKQGFAAATALPPTCLSAYRRLLALRRMAGSSARRDASTERPVLLAGKMLRLTTCVSKKRCCDGRKVAGAAVGAACFAARPFSPAPHQPHPKGQLFRPSSSIDSSHPLPSTMIKGSLLLQINTSRHHWLHTTTAHGGGAVLEGRLPGGEPGAVYKATGVPQHAAR